MKEQWARTAAANRQAVDEDEHEERMDDDDEEEDVEMATRRRGADAEDYSERSGDDGDEAEGAGAAAGVVLLLDEFKGQVEEVKDVLLDVRGQLKQLEALQAELIAATTPKEQARLSAEVRELTGEISDATDGVRASLQAMKAESDRLEASEHQKDVGLLDTRSVWHGNLTAKFVELMSDFQNNQSGYQSRMRAALAQQIRLVDPSATDALIDEVLDRGDAPQVFAQALADEKRHQDASNALTFLEEQHQDLLQLEENIAKLADMFKEMRQMVKEQGALLDSIESCVDAAREYHADTLANLVEADKIQKSNRRKIVIIVVLIVFFCCFFTCLVICLIIAAVVALFVLSGGCTAVLGLGGSVLAAIVSAVGGAVGGTQGSSSSSSSGNRTIARLLLHSVSASESSSSTGRALLMIASGVLDASDF
jgi:syntaxin 1B/2/3